MDIIHIPASLVLGCNNPVAVNALSDFIEETTGHPLFLMQSGYDDGYEHNHGYKYGNNYGYGDGYGYGNGDGDGDIYGNGNGDDNRDINDCHWGDGYGNGNGDGY